MKRVLFSFLLFCFIHAAAAAQGKPFKVACFNRDSLLLIMPEAQKARDSVAAYRRMLERQLAQMQLETEYKLREADSIALHTSTRPTFTHDITYSELAENIEVFRQSAEADVRRLEEALFLPIRAKIDAAAEKIATENGYAFVLDSSAGNAVICAVPTYDIFNDMCRALNIPEKPPTQKK